ncbi:hypothetical protein [Bacillus infantis]
MVNLQLPAAISRSFIKGEAGASPKTKVKVRQMTINHAGSLKKEYFISYMNLLMKAFECSVDEAKERTFERLFRLNENEMGKETFAQFHLAYQELLKRSKES